MAYSTDEEIILPDLVGISDKKYDDSYVENSVNYFGITYPRKFNNKQDTTIAVCPGPIQGNFENALRIAEYVEMYKLLGASKFYFYNMSMSKEVEKLAKFYESQGLVETVSWNIDHVLKLDESVIHYYGIMATLNDCFYRATAIDNFKYVILTDFDEIIYPYKTETISELLELHDSNEFHSLTISNYFVFAEFPNDFSNVPETAVNKFLYSQALTTRMRDVTGDVKWYRVRTKGIAKRDFVIETGNHYSWSGVKGTKEKIISHNDAMMYHYRDHCLVGYCNLPMTRDTFARKFASKIWQKVDEICEKVFDNGICPIGEITNRVDS